MIEYWLFALFLAVLFGLGLLEYWLGLTGKSTKLGIIGPGAFFYLIWFVVTLTYGFTEITMLFLGSQIFTAYLFFSFFQAGKRNYSKQLAETREQLEDGKL
ncbi:MAG: hypothetical protein ABF804_04170 [Liquorilactobacillus ghanensis]|uniref:hypothetical protein n=1 Tax=Liquorilactobacillus ghanensis TaxID=399370 RepID=UPI0039EA3504